MLPSVAMARPRRRVGNVPAETTSFVGRRRDLRRASSCARERPPRQPGRPGRRGQDTPRASSGDGPRAWLRARSVVGRPRRDPRCRARVGCSRRSPRPAGPGLGRAAADPVVLPAGPRDAARLRQLRARARRVRRPGGGHPSCCTRHPRHRHEPGALAGRRRTRRPGGAAGAAARGRRATGLTASPERSRDVVRGASGSRSRVVRTGCVEPIGRRRPVPTTRRPAARDRACRCQDACAHRRADPRSTHGPVRPPDRRRTRGTASAADAQDDHRLEP